jgi:Subtilase family
MNHPMRRQFVRFGFALSFVVLGGCSGSNVNMLLPAAHPGTASHGRILRAPLGPHSILPNAAGISSHALCAATNDPGRASCFATVRMASSSQAALSGLQPNDLANIYNYTLPSQQGQTSQVIGIVIAGGAPNAPSDLAAYRSQFGLGDCTTASGCLTVISATSASSQSSERDPDSISPHPTYGGPQANSPSSESSPSAGEDTSDSVMRAPKSISPHPTVPTNGASPGLNQRSTQDASRGGQSISPHPTTIAGGWSDEADIDLEAASAVCSNCQLLLVQAASDSLADLGAAVTQAQQNGATIINASFGAPESSSDTYYTSAFQPQGVKVVAAAGDNGPGVYFPASARKTIAVAGTTVNISGNSVSETLWSGSGGGCSSVFNQPNWEANYCNGMRSVADVAAVADPNTGIAFYDSNLGGWGVAGGTSVAAPIIAGMWALQGNVQQGQGAAMLWYDQSDFYQVPNAGAFDGVGTPDGTSGL